MKMKLRVLHQIHHWLLRFYPGNYREEYGEELQTVFGLSIDVAIEKGMRETIQVVIRELIGLPRAIAYEHLRQRRRTKMIKRLGSRFNFTQGSGAELLAAIVPYLLFVALFGGIPMLFSYFAKLPESLVNASALLLLGVFLILFIMGVMKGFPRWSLPYIGVLLSFISVYGFSELIHKLYGFYDFYDTSWLLGQLVFQGYLWSGLTVAAIMLVMATAAIPIFQRFRDDWSLPCFLFYGAAPFAILFTFDDYQHEEPYVLLAFSIQAFGVWYYLRTHGPWNRFAILFAALTASMFVAAAGKAILGPSQFWFHGQQIQWWGNEMMSTITIWVWIAVSMLVPTAINLLQRYDDHSPIVSLES